MRRMESNKFCHLKRFNILSLDTVFKYFFIKFHKSREEFQSELWTGDEREISAASFSSFIKDSFLSPPSHLPKKCLKFYLHCCTWLHFQESWIFPPTFLRLSNFAFLKLFNSAQRVETPTHNNNCIISSFLLPILFVS